VVFVLAFGCELACGIGLRHSGGLAGALPSHRLPRFTVLVLPRPNSRSHQPERTMDAGNRFLPPAFVLLLIES
jgi:hypothetical protein